jgi:hypothetical protein
MSHKRDLSAPVGTKSESDSDARWKHGSSLKASQEIPLLYENGGVNYSFHKISENWFDPPMRIDVVANRWCVSYRQ